MDGITKEQVEACKSQAELSELLGQGKIKNAPLRQEGLDLSIEDRRRAVLEQNRRNPPKMYGQVPTKRKRHPLGLGYLDDDDEQFAVRSAVDEKLRQVKEARSQKEIDDILAGLANE